MSIEIEDVTPGIEPPIEAARGRSIRHLGRAQALAAAAAGCAAFSLFVGTNVYLYVAYVIGSGEATTSGRNVAEVESVPALVPTLAALILSVLALRHWRRDDASAGSPAEEGFASGSTGIACVGILTASSLILLLNVVGLIFVLASKTSPNT